MASIGREEDGWARSAKDHQEWLRHFYHTHEGQEDVAHEFVNAGAPVTIKPVDRFLNDVKGLVKIFAAEAPPVIVLGSQNVFLVTCGFGDASG
jgi:hypothetical protein